MEKRFIVIKWNLYHIRDLLSINENYGQKKIYYKDNENYII